MSRAAMQAALEALGACTGVPHWPSIMPVINDLRAALAQPEQQAADWTTPTSYYQRMSDAITLLCSGKRPPEKMVFEWLDSTSEELQEFCIEHGPAWAQGIVLIDAARVMADTPAEGVDHEAVHPPAQPEQQARPLGWMLPGDVAMRIGNEHRVSAAAIQDIMLALHRMNAPSAQPEPQAPQKERPDFIAGYDAGLTDGRRIAERGRAEQPLPRIWYMRDNHTFRELPLDVEQALIAMRDDRDAGHTYGTLCGRSGDRIDHGHVHAGKAAEWDQFEAQARPWLEKVVALAGSKP